jgi:hypothetical protein
MSKAATDANAATLAEIAGKLLALEKNDIAGVIEKGRLLQDAFDLLKHGGREKYHQWVKTELCWSESTEARYRKVHDFAKFVRPDKFGGFKIEELDISKEALYLLAAADRSFPKPIKEALKLASTSRVGLAQVNEIIAKHSAAAPPEPNELSKAIEVILDNGPASPQWEAAATIIGYERLQEAARTLGLMAREIVQRDIGAKSLPTVHQEGTS